jgi:hypothetical protein
MNCCQQSTIKTELFFKHKNHSLFCFTPFRIKNAQSLTNFPLKNAQKLQKKINIH